MSRREVLSQTLQNVKRRMQKLFRSSQVLQRVSNSAKHDPVVHEFRDRDGLALHETRKRVMTVLVSLRALEFFDWTRYLSTKIDTSTCKGHSHSKRRL